MEMLPLYASGTTGGGVEACATGARSAGRLGTAAGGGGGIVSLVSNGTDADPFTGSSLAAGTTTAIFAGLSGVAAGTVGFGVDSGNATFEATGGWSGAETASLVAGALDANSALDAAAGCGVGLGATTAAAVAVEGVASVGVFSGTGAKEAEAERGAGFRAGAATFACIATRSSPMDFGPKNQYPATRSARTTKATLAYMPLRRRGSSEISIGSTSRIFPPAGSGDAPRLSRSCSILLMRLILRASPAPSRAFPPPSRHPKGVRPPPKGATLGVFG